MNAQQQQKAIKALEEKKAKEHKQFLAMLFHTGVLTRYCMDLKSKCMREHLKKCFQTNSIQKIGRAHV